MVKPVLLDMFCGAGGAAMGYSRAGFDILGVDINPQPHYPFNFIQDDALDFLAGNWKRFDAVHASPPCQFASRMFCPTKPEKRQNHINLIPVTRQLLKATGKAYVIENVAGARKHLINPVKLQGGMFGLRVWRDRYFELSFDLWFGLPFPDYGFVPVPVNSSSKVGNKHAPVAIMRQAMDIDWMTKSELRQAIPPAYTEFLGMELIKVC